MAAFWSGSSAAFLEAPEAAILGALSRAQVWHFRKTEAAQMPVWRESVALLKAAVLALRDAGFEAFVLLEYPILRLGKRIDAVVLTDRAIFVLEFKRAQADAEALRQTEDYGLDLFDFHAHSRAHAVVPVLVTGGAGSGVRMAGLPFSSGVLPVQLLAPLQLGGGMMAILRGLGVPRVALDIAGWESGAYRSVRAFCRCSFWHPCSWVAA